MTKILQELFKCGSCVAAQRGGDSNEGNDIALFESMEKEDHNKCFFLVDFVFQIHL